MRPVLIDNHDSFSFNIVQALARAGAEPRVLTHDRSMHELLAEKPTHLIFSPGPGSANDEQSLGLCVPALRWYCSRIPILGVCLGHQWIARYFGCRVVRAAEVAHGKVDRMQLVERGGIFFGMPGSFAAMRYHSYLVARRSFNRHELEISCVNGEGLIMGIRHRRRPVFGVQFHPESIATPRGGLIFKNFLRQAERAPAEAPCAVENEGAHP